MLASRSQPSLAALARAPGERVSAASPSAAMRYGYAVLAVVLALVAALVLRTFDLEGFLFVIAVAVAVWVGGRGPGIVAVLLSIAVLHFVFIAPFDTGAMLPTSAYFVVFSVLAVLITTVSEARHRAERSLVRARDDLEVRVRARTAELELSNRQLRDEIEERRRAEAALRLTEAELAHVSRVTTLGEVTASFAHEINQPLAAIVNNANACLALLPSGGDCAEVSEALRDIVGDAVRASAIIDRVRALARRSSPEKVSLRLADVVADVLALAASDAAARGVVIETDVAPELPPVLGDRVQLQQVLLNLVVNAMDALRDVPAPRQLALHGAVETEHGATVVALRVRDGGSGLEPAQLTRLFEPFYTTKAHGMGMGLAISRSIIAAHGGRLWAEANADAGATFAFTLPAAGGEDTRG